MASKGNDGDGISRLTLYDGPDFTGSSKVIMESVSSAGNILGAGKKIQSMVIQGNPWLIYPEEQMKVIIVSIIRRNECSILILPLHHPYTYYTN